MAAFLLMGAVTFGCTTFQSYGTGENDELADSTLGDEFDTATGLENSDVSSHVTGSDASSETSATPGDSSGVSDESSSATAVSSEESGDSSTLSSESSNDESSSDGGSTSVEESSSATWSETNGESSISESATATTSSSEGSDSTDSSSSDTSNETSTEDEDPCAALIVPDEPPMICSKSSAKKAKISFTNLCTKTVLRINWVNYGCHEDAPVIELQPGETRVVSTYLTHPWRVRDAKDGRLMLDIPPVSSVVEMVSIPF
jgi:hypothetical protein